LIIANDPSKSTAIGFWYTPAATDFPATPMTTYSYKASDQSMALPNLSSRFLFLIASVVRVRYKKATGFNRIAVFLPTPGRRR